MQKYFIGAGALFCLSLLGTTPALANTTNLSFEPSYASQPFSFYCDPYKVSFTSGEHYVVPNNSNCFFTIPSDITGSKTIVLYKGVPGHATFVSGDQVMGPSPTLVQEDSSYFGSPAQDQDYFAAVYGWNSTVDAAQWDAYFRTGSSTAGGPPNSNFHIIQWKWGGKPVSEYEPVVIIPGILGSWEKNGAWVLDPVAHTYDNLVDTFLANGYVDGKTLFKFGYDWEEPNEVTASLLATQIQSIKQTCGCSRVNLVAHSMGGLVAEQYIESAAYGNDVDNLVFIATPLLGAPEAYKAWEGGEVDFSNKYINALMQTDFWVEAEENGYKNVFDYIQHRPIESIQELLPIYDDYLYDNTVGERTYPTGYPVNGFLESLLTNIQKITHTVQITSILGNDQKSDTPDGYLVQDSTQPPKWPDGEVTDTFYGEGDGTVPQESISNLFTPDKEFDGVDHVGIVSTSSSYVFQRLNNEVPTIIINKTYSAPTSFLRFSLESPVDMEITAPDGKRVGKNFSTNTELDEVPNAFYSGFATGTEYAVIVNPLPGAYQVNTIGTGSGGKYTLVAGYFNGATTTETELVGSTTPGQIIDHTALLSSTTTAVTLSTILPIPTPPSDTQPPLVVITNPVASKQYTHADIIKIAATITDQSPIASTTYTFNGKLVASSTPISLAGVPLGTSTILVSATDKFGNIGSSSVSFQIIATPESCKWDIALAYRNKWITKKTIYDAMTSGCDSLSELFKDRDTWNKIPVPKRDKKIQQSLANTLSVLQSLFNSFDGWIKDKSNTKDALQLLNQNLQWFRTQ